uniref:ABC transporter permease n=1 Tax=Caenorhabditis tropicalis TaxID=1561998 RepID=A0A1I7UWQ2_9PELO
MSSLALRFVYRYWAIFRPRNIRKYFDGRNFALPVFYVFITGSLWFIASVSFTRMDDYGIRYLERDILASYGVLISELPALAFVVYDDEGAVRIENVSGMGIMVLLMIISPTITLFSPLALLISIPYFDVDISFPGILSNAFTAYPGIECIIIIYMASFYNTALRVSTMKFIFWANLGKEITKYGFYFTAVFTILFVILTLFYVKENIGSYRYLLLLLPITGFMLALLEKLLEPARHF